MIEFGKEADRDIVRMADGLKTDPPKKLNEQKLL